MLAGHYATALVADQHTQKNTLFFFLFASALPDLLWHVFALVGIEPTEPANVLDMTLQNLEVDMMFSHDLLPTLGWMALLYGFGTLAFKSHKIGLIAALLLLGHNLADYAAGYPHHVFGPETPAVGFAAYKSVPLLAVAYEAVFAAIFLFVFFRTEHRRGVRRKPGNIAAIIGLFAFTVAFLVTCANTSLREYLGLPEIDSILLLTIPNLMLTYWAMLFYLFYFVSAGKPTPVADRA